MDGYQDFHKAKRFNFTRDIKGLVADKKDPSIINKDPTNITRKWQLATPWACCRLKGKEREREREGVNERERER